MNVRHESLHGDTVTVRMHMHVRATYTTTAGIG